MIQGFSTGGQYGTAATYLSEIAGKGRRGFWASFQYVTLIGGQLLATLVVLILQQVLPEESMKAYGWRIAFLIGAAGAATILLFRHHMHETLSGEDKHQNAGSIKELLTKNGWAFLTVMALSATGGLAFYTFTTYMQKYLVLTAGMSKETATGVMTAALIVFMIQQPLMGHLSDKIGRKNNIIIWGALGALTTAPILMALATVQSAVMAFLLVVAGLTFNSFYTAVSGVYKAELFPVHVRTLGVGLAYGIGNALFGGTAENVALAFKNAGNESYFYWYVTAFMVMALLVAFTLPDSRKNNVLDEIKV